MLPLYDIRMLSVVDHMKKEGIYNGAFLQSIGFPERNLPHVRHGHQSFKIEHIAATISIYKVNPDYFFKKSAKMFS